MTDFSHLKGLWVDFNDIYGDFLTDTLDYTNYALNEQVVACDYDGNICNGTVVGFPGKGFVTIKLDLSTFHPAVNV